MMMLMISVCLQSLPSRTELILSGLFEGCPATRDIHSSRASWISISALMLSIYSTVFSGIWLILAIVQPRYGHAIHSRGSFTPSTASTLFALFAKTIELSFVTVFVTFLGQVLSRRSIIKASRGVTIPELTMRTWVIQPGFMITHWQHIQHAGLTILGGIALTAAFVSVFYTTASDALVSPHLKYGGWEKKEMWGLVQSSYANTYFIADNCQTPITISVDSQSATTCLALEHAGQGIYFMFSHASSKLTAISISQLSRISRYLDNDSRRWRRRLDRSLRTSCASWAALRQYDGDRELGQYGPEQRRSVLPEVQPHYKQCNDVYAPRWRFLGSS